MSLNNKIDLLLQNVEKIHNQKNDFPYEKLAHLENRMSRIEGRLDEAVHNTAKICELLNPKHALAPFIPFIVAFFVGVFSWLGILTNLIVKRGTF